MVLGDFVAVASTVAIAISLVFAALGVSFLKRKRSMVEWLIGSSGFLITAFGYAYYSSPDLYFDESSYTKKAFFVIFGFLLAIGTFSGAKWGRSLVLWLTGITFVLITVFAYFEGLYILPFGVVSLVLFFIFRIRKNAFTKN